MPTTKIVLVTGERLEVEGQLADVVKVLENAARSGAGRLAWLTDAASGETMGINPAHFVTVVRGED
jgi:hypothetical protein